MENQELIIKSLLAYGLTNTVLAQPESGYRSKIHPFLAQDDRRLALIIFKDEPQSLQRIKNANYVSNFLAVNKFPSRRQADSRLLVLRSPHHTNYAGLYDYIAGKTIPWEGYTKDHLKLIGKYMSQMHLILAGLPADHVLGDTADEYLDILQNMKKYFFDPSVSFAITAKLDLKINVHTFDSTEKILLYCRWLKDKQPLHMDFVRSNLLFMEAAHPNDLGVELAGVIDFEKTSYGIRLFDIARTLAFLLVDCKYKSEDKIRKYFLFSGYNKRGPLKFEDIHLAYKRLRLSLLEQLIDLFLFYDLYKFLRHNPYEYLRFNEHYRRTKLLLAERGKLDLLDKRMLK